MSREPKGKYSDFTNARDRQKKLIPEEFPEGAFGSPINESEPVSGKSTPWEEGQYRESAFVYPDKSMHKDVPRQAPTSHPTQKKE
ncbi:hypothetical protein ACTWPF_07240 [Oceanobacillus sp. M65]|uniref:hypothetical protein n=1 Tax=Oceanobacillus sp. M65 TaxID=3457435 RepID=UPI003FCD53AF